MSKKPVHASSPASVTASTMPRSYTSQRPRSESIPSLKERAEKARLQASLALGCFALVHLLDGNHSADEAFSEEFRRFTGYIIDPDDYVVAAGRALNSAIEELFWISNHPDQTALEMSVPTDEDWEHYQRDQAEESGGAR